MHAIDTPLITIKLKAAEPTIVAGPSSPGSDPRLETVSITDSKISGADDPSAIKVKFAIVGFHTETVIVCSTPSISVYVMARVWEVITSMQSIKMSETIAIPKNKYTRAKKYAMANNQLGRSEVPGIITHECQNSSALVYSTILPLSSVFTSS